MTHFNPGNAWVSKLCFEPKVGVQAIEQMLQPYIDTGRLRIFYQYRPVAVTTQDGRINEVEVESVNPTAAEAQRLRFTAMVLDATDLGDLLPLAGIDYVSGTQGVADTGETHAYPGPSQPDWVQSFTYPFAVGIVQARTIRYPSRRDTSIFGTPRFIHSTCTMHGLVVSDI